MNFFSLKNRAIIAGASTAACYGMIYLVSPDILPKFNVNLILTNPESIVNTLMLSPKLLAPPVLAGAGVLIPKFLKRPKIGLSGSTKAAKSEKKNATGTGFAQPAPSPSPQFQSGSVNETAIPASRNLASQLGPAPNPGLGLGDPKPLVPQPSVLTEVVEKKLAPITEEILSIKNEITSFKKDVEELKGGVKEITSSFENSLVELKAFQAEMVNPINFMRKYFETMDIKSLSDPVNAIKRLEQIGTNPRPIYVSDNIQQKLGSSQPVEAIRDETSLSRRTELTELNQMDPPAIESVRLSESMNKHASEQNSEKQLYSEADDLSQRPRQNVYSKSDVKASNNREPIIEKHVSGNPSEILRISMERGITPGKIMSIVGIVDEILATMGPDGIDLIVEQYRSIGLKPEEERLIYGVLKMLNESKMLTDDIISMLYRFGQVLGINDEETELNYTRLLASRKGRKHGVSGRGKLGERAA